MAAVFYLLGWCLVGLGGLFVVPFLWELSGPAGDWQIFGLSAFLSAFLGTSLIMANRQKTLSLSIRQGFLLVVLIYFGFTLIAALPFLFSSGTYALSLTDALFEAASGLTTTGATVYSGLDQAPEGILVWRSLLQWAGGLGMVVLTMALLPYFHVGGMEIFSIESPEGAEKILSHVGKIAGLSAFIYAALTLACLSVYLIGGMSPFEALNHAMTTLATGGFSTHDASFSHFNSAFLEWSAVVFMIAGGTPLLLYLVFFRKNLKQGPLFSQARLFWKGLALLIFGFSVYRYLVTEQGLMETVREVAFTITSIVTTTGFVTQDYTLWGGVFVTAIYILMAIGGCTGSTSGGIKIFRLQVLTKLAHLELNRLSHPHGVFGVFLGGRKVDSQVFMAIGKFMILYGVVFAFVTFGLAFNGLDFMSSLSGAASALSNVGPGLGEVIGPTGNYGALTDPAKWILSLAMIAGRLEIFCLLALFTPLFWREFS